jgi:nucleotide-binding universal stress UspA family protein
MSAAQRCVLTTTDGSEHAQAAVTWAADLANVMSARLQVATVVVIEQAEVSTELYNEYLAEGALRLEKWVGEAGVVVDPSDRIVTSGEPAEAIPRVAESVSADVVVLGASGSEGTSRLGLGGPPHRIAHAVGATVATGHEPSRLGDNTQVVVGVDGSPGSTRALRFARKLAGALGSTAMALFVQTPSAQLRTSAHHVAQTRQLAAVKRQAAAMSGDVDMRIVVGDPVAELCAHTARSESSVLVVGKRSRGIAQGALYGRVPMELLHGCRRPVVLVR